MDRLGNHKAFPTLNQRINDLAIAVFVVVTVSTTGSGDAIKLIHTTIATITVVVSILCILLFVSINFVVSARGIRCLAVTVAAFDHEYPIHDERVNDYIEARSV